MSRLSAPCCGFVGEVGEVSLPAGLRGVCGPWEGRLRSWKAGGFPHGYRVENQAGERDGVAYAPSPRLTADGNADRLKVFPDFILQIDVGVVKLPRCLLPGF